ncbi:MAG TPA: lyase family protein [Streptosporangiaceae bacterium]|nr:lyase family protein [Streptosporangiaceae bacterium]
MSGTDYLGLGTRLDTGPSDLLVEAGFRTESRQAPYLHDGLSQADLAHLLGLRDRSLLPEPAGTALLRAVLGLAGQRPEELAYDPADGDAYNSREQMLRAQVGSDAGWLSLGRTRREAGRVAFYLAARAALLRLHAAVADLAEAGLEQAVAHADSWWADLTYWQPAQVSTFGHYLLSGAYEAARHLDRIERAWHRCGLVPVAAGGVAGTTIPLSRNGYLRRLGLGGTVTTTRDAMWSVDGLLDISFAATHVATTAGRAAEDLQLFATVPFGYAELDDAHCRASVYLPQKRNPYALTVVRAGAAQVAGRAGGLVTSLHTSSAQTDNWIFNYGEVLETVDIARQGCTLMGEVIQRARFDAERMAAMALDGFAAAADLAECLVVEAGLDYRTAHSLVARVASEAQARGDTRLGPADHGRLAELAGVALKPMDPRSLVLSRGQAGGAAPSQIRAGASRLRHRLGRHRAWNERSLAAARQARDRLTAEATAAADRS